MSSSSSLSVDYVKQFGVPKEYLMEDGTPDYLKLILTSRVYDICKETPMTEAVGLSTKFGRSVLLKREDLQPVFSFKLRGAYNKIAHLTKQEKSKGVIACSAGNHAQGVAYSAKHLNIPATIVMPTATPSIKYSSVDRMGAKVVLYGDDFDSAKTECTRLTEQQGLTNIPPFDDPYVIAGQGTIGLETLRQVDTSKLKVIFCAIGGGGLIAGVGAYIKRIAPHVKIIGVETFDADAMYQSFQKHERVVLSDVGLFADGAAVKTTGEETFRLAMKYVDEIIRVTTDELCAGIKDVFNETRAIVEPTGALSVAGLKKYFAREGLDVNDANGGSDDDAYVAVLSGANMNFSRLGFVTERAQLGEGTEVFSIVNIPERPGSFLELVSAIQPRAITEFVYRYSSNSSRSSSEPDEGAFVYLSFSVSDRNKEIESIKQQLEAKKFKYYDISNDEFSKSHARYLVGGKVACPNERIFSFEFPERPGALFRFLGGLKSNWNITLFHYRNNGSDIGKVVTGIACPPEDSDKLQEFLQMIQYPYKEETDNVAYKLFLKA